MLRFSDWSKESLTVDSTIGYAVATTTVVAALSLVSLLFHLSVRDPVALIYLAAIAVSFWYGKTGPGILAFSSSAVCLLVYFRVLEHSWVQVVRSDLPILCLYVAFACWIYLFAKSRRHLEYVLKNNGEELEAAVKARTTDLFRINAEYKTILDAAPFGIALFGRERIVERCNPEYEKMLGYGPGEILAQRAPLPEDQREAWEEMEGKLRSGESIADHQVPRLRRDGSRFSATIWLTPLHDCHGEYAGMVGFILDSTERNVREAERQMLATLVECSPDLVAVTDEAGEIVFINGAGQRLLGIDRDVDLTQLNLAKRFHYERQRNGAKVWESLSIGNASFDIEAKGSERDIQLHCTSFRMPPATSGGFTLLALVAQDISERTEAEEKLRASLEENQRLLAENRLLQEKLRHENISLQERNIALQSEIADIQRARFEKIIGESPAIRRTLNKIEQVAGTDVTVLITGETGTGKELIAQAIHENSKRAGMPFRAINCAALPSTLVATELFGHEKGAFTGADRLRLGQFELASGGTLFLDEVAEMPVETQAMLLRVLEERGFERLGGTKLISSDVRIIAATNRDLQVAMQRGEFRPDLFFRLNGLRIEVPPLRERKDDIPLLVQHFVNVSSTRYGKAVRSIEKQAMEMLLVYGWPGNVRELRNVIDVSVIISPGCDLVIDEELLFGAPMAGNLTQGTLEAKVAQYERSLIERALTETRGRVSGPSGAANSLGMPASTLSARMRVLKIDAAKFKLQQE
jgi:PAS domain S-box-containing protein